MTNLEVMAVLVQLGVNEHIAAAMVVVAHNMGKYESKHILPDTGEYRTIGVYHGMKGNTTHYYTIEIS